jgi:hypothetical protein
VNSCIPTDSAHPSLASAITRKRLLAVGEQKRSGLILCKSHAAEFAGPGAAICSPHNISYDQIITIGSPEIVEVTGYQERQQAYGRRIQWVRWLQRIITEPEATQRAEKLFAGFEEFFGSEVLNDLPNEVLALLAGVLPHTIHRLRSQQLEIARVCQPNAFSHQNRLDIKVIQLAAPIDSLDSHHFSALLNSQSRKAFYKLPCSA